MPPPVTGLIKASHLLAPNHGAVTRESATLRMGTANDWKVDVGVTGRYIIWPTLDLRIRYWVWGVRKMYPPVCKIHDAVLALLAVCLSRWEPVARLQTQCSALWRLVECCFARKRCIAAAIADHDPAALPVSPAFLQVLHVAHARGAYAAYNETGGV
jgi:hypothetical protein